MAGVGFYGGSTLNLLGPAGDVQLFFDCIDQLVVPKAPDEDWEILSDRLYRRYLHLEDLAPAQALMDRVAQAFAAIPALAVDWGDAARPGSSTRLNPAEGDLQAVFSRYFELFSLCRQSAEAFLQAWGRYQPIRLVVADLPAFLAEKARSLAEYDGLEGDPFWRRPAAIGPGQP